MCVSHQLGPPGSLWSQVPAEEKTVVTWCPKRLVTGDFVPVPLLLVQVKTPRQAGKRVFSPLATKQAHSASGHRSAYSHFLLRDSTHTGEIQRLSGGRGWVG